MAMSETKSVHDWSKDWEALQRQYWNAWTDLTRSQAGTTPDASTPWHEGLEQWARMFGAAGRQSEAAERLMSSAKSYLSLMQSMLAFAAGRDAGALNVPTWLEAMRNGMNVPGFDYSAFKMPAFDPSAFGKVPGFDASLLDNPMAKALREISGQGVKGFEQLASGALPWLQQFQQEGQSWLRAPAFGYAREHQEHYQKMALAFVEFQEALKKYNALILKSSQRSFEILESKIAEHSEPGRQIDSIRALYDLWVDAAEEAYAEIALSDEFREVYGEVVNSQMRVRSQLQQEVERIGVDLGMPTRTELNSVHQRLHDLRRELRESQEARLDAAGDGRDGEIAAMRAEIDELRRLLINSGPAAAGAAAAAPRKRAAAGTKRKTATGRRTRAKTKRAAAKRSHVATKTEPVDRRKPAAAAKTEPTAPAAVAAPAKATHAKKRRPPRRAPDDARAKPAAPKLREEKSAATTVSFGDAIAAMRREVAGNGKQRKARAARMALPRRVSPPLRPRRRNAP
jgi:poly[(R)-3-hydroxyalkanoate] polymerase subunit PhaE